MESIFQVISSSRDCEKISEAECSKGENLRGGVEEGSKRSVGCTSKTVSTEHESNQMGAMFFIFLITEHQQIAFQIAGPLPLQTITPHT